MTIMQFNKIINEIQLQIIDIITFHIKEQKNYIAYIKQDIKIMYIGKDSNMHFGIQ